MSTKKNTPHNYEAPGARIAGPDDPSVAEDFSSKTGTLAILALLAIIAVIVLAALFANGLYRSQLKHTIQEQGVSNASSAATKARSASAQHAEARGTANAGALLLGNADALAGTSDAQLAQGGDAADIPELPSYAAVLDPEAAARAAAEEEAADDEGEEAADPEASEKEDAAGEEGADADADAADDAEQNNDENDAPEAADE